MVQQLKVTELTYLARALKKLILRMKFEVAIR